MANAVYPKALEEHLQGLDLSSVDVKVQLLQNAAFDAGDEFLADIAGGDRLGGLSSAIGSKTFTGGVFDGSDPTVTAVPVGTAIGYVVLIDTTVEGTSRLLAYIDTEDAEFGGDPISFPTNGGDVTVQFPAAGIYSI